MNSLTIIGNVGSPPNFRYTKDGVAVCDFTVAVNKTTGKGEQRKQTTTWFRCTVWREKAETASQYVTKGMKICVMGEIGLSVYTAKDGTPQATLELSASSFEFLGGGERREKANEGPAAGHPSDGFDESDLPI